MNSSMRPSSLRRVAALVQLVLALFLFDRGLYRLIVGAENAFYRDAPYFARFREFAKDKTFDTLILGSSRTYEGIHPVHFEKRLRRKAYKEAYFGRGPRYNLHFYRHFKKLFGPPKVVVYGVDYFMFTAKSDKRWLTKFEPDRRPLKPFETPSALLGNKKEIEDFLNDIRTALEGYIERRPVRPNRDFLRIQTYAGRKPAAGRIKTDKPQRFPRGPYRPYPGREGDYLRPLLEELARDGVRVALVTIPEYIGTYETNFEHGRFLQDIGRLIRDFPNARLYDFNQPEVFPLTRTECFINGGWGITNSHLSKRGAELFSRMLLKKIAPLYAAAGRPGAQRGSPAIIRSRKTPSDSGGQ